MCNILYTSINFLFYFYEYVTFPCLLEKPNKLLKYEHGSWYSPLPFDCFILIKIILYASSVI